ncbi:MAG: COX15/CtaA family protein, partial [Streptosporangiaceae bacterium]
MSAQPATANPGWRATALVRHWAGVLLRPTPLAMRRIAFVGVLASLAIIPTGAAVRLSQSGLGCTDWPDCTANSLVASGEHGDPLIHQWVEFGNRLV